ncbi:hypothetical protein HBH56_035370 [Parastagonospora nodorum]|nr:hypothetical protein HBH56_035370 [Parastagonospora nodorum]KAH3952744.1 hypothetical protein HBH53_046010 [Parastagonospora nodorum]KAH3979496.1 hypothetical protein HBH51_057030 [Parastagonospora nodorum]KAH3980481.1 hypothetical protein HBH52_093180 [Parastagonospora nodorum]KAH4031893.1 hypothetical protein HBI13_017130 [Parastagonospora nodorum]
MIVLNGPEGFLQSRPNAHQALLIPLALQELCSRKGTMRLVSCKESSLPAQWVLCSEGQLWRWQQWCANESVAPRLSQEKKRRAVQAKRRESAERLRSLRGDEVDELKREGGRQGGQGGRGCRGRAPCDTRLLRCFGGLSRYPTLRSRSVLSGTVHDISLAPGM